MPSGVRVALTMEQIRLQEPPPNFAKETSPRFEQYVQRTGSDECWEVEAIDPEYLQSELRSVILNVLDTDQLNAVQEHETEEREQIADMRRRLGTTLRRIIADEGI
jgi:hypothetical protein